MTTPTDTIGLMLAVFAASFVECVEAFTIVLAIGLTRSWKAAIVGSIVALVALSATVAVVGVGLGTFVNAAFLQIIVGSLMLVFGLQWLRKAILRSSGLKAIHNEEKIFQEEQEAARQAGNKKHLGLDWFAFVVSFKAVFLEGLEVMFIVITFGVSASKDNPDAMFHASLGALAALPIVIIMGYIARGPLSSVPENALKFTVALVLCTFGVYWSAEGLGYFSPDHTSMEWPGGDWALLALLVLWGIISYVSVKVLRPYHKSRGLHV